MDRSRLKNIIILILVLVNGFLLASLAQRRSAERDASRRTAEQLAALFQADGMVLDARAISRDAPPDGVALSRATALEEQAAAFLLGDALTSSDQGGGIYHYAGAAGEALFRSSGSFEASGILAERDAASLPFLLAQIRPDREALSAACAQARELGDTAALAVLLEEQHRRSPAGLGKSFTL